MVNRCAETSFTLFMFKVEGLIGSRNEFGSEPGPTICRRWGAAQQSQIELANPFPTNEDLKEGALLGGSKSDRQAGKGLPGVKPVAFKAHLAFGTHQAHLVSVQILRLGQFCR